MAFGGQKLCLVREMLGLLPLQLLTRGAFHLAGVTRGFCSRSVWYRLPASFFIILTRSLSTRFRTKVEDGFKRHDTNSMTRRATT